MLEAETVADAPPAPCEAGPSLPSPAEEPPFLVRMVIFGRGGVGRTRPEDVQVFWSDGSVTDGSAIDRAGVFFNTEEE